jgi:glutathione S-transferase
VELYYAPFSCSMAARIVAAEAGIPLEFRQVELFAKTLTESGASYLEISPLGIIPVLRLDDGSLLTEVSAVLQYLADARPESELAPRWGTMERYRVIEWLSFVGTEIHKKILWVTYNPETPEESKAHARKIAPRVFDHLERHFGRTGAGTHLVGDRFTVADAYLVWALHLLRVAGFDVRPGRPALEAYGKRVRDRASVKAASELERPLALAAHQRQRDVVSG